MTIGVAFLCSDGIVICADMQITWPANHKYYECKLYPHTGGEWTVVTTFAGNPEVMKSFDGKFKDSMALMPAPYTASKIQDNIETVLSFFDVLREDTMQLSLLCGIVIKNKEFRLLKTEGRTVREVPRFDYVGAGDSSLLRYLAPLLTQTGKYTCEQALNLGTFLVLQAKRYIDGCGGETNARVLKPQGSAVLIQETYRVEQQMLKLEFLLGRVATAFFDLSYSEAEFNDAVDRFAASLKSHRPMR